MDYFLFDAAVSVHVVRGDALELPLSIQKEGCSVINLNVDRFEGHCFLNICALRMKNNAAIYCWLSMSCVGGLSRYVVGGLAKEKNGIRYDK